MSKRYVITPKLFLSEPVDRGWIDKIKFPIFSSWGNIVLIDLTEAEKDELEKELGDDFVIEETLQRVRNIDSLGT